jgi:hypothetical protein
VTGKKANKKMSELNSISSSFFARMGDHFPSEQDGFNENCYFIHPY